MVLLTWLLGVSRGDTLLFLPNLVEVQDVGACVVRLWSHVVAPVFRELLCLDGGLVVTGVHYRTVVVAVCTSCIASSVSCEREHLYGELRVAFLQVLGGPGVSCKRVLLLLLGACAASVVAIFARAAVGFILGLCIRGVSLLDVCLALCACAPLGAVLCSVGVFARAKQMLVCRVAPLVEHCDTCLWLLSALYWLVVNSVVVALPSGLRCIAWLIMSYRYCRLDCPCYSMPRRCRLRCHALGRAPGSGAGQVVFLSVFEFLSCAGETSWVPVVGWLASFLAPCVLCQMASSRCVFPLVPQLRLDALVAVWCVALSAYGGRSDASCCALLRANMVVALLKLLVLRVFCFCASLVESPFRVVVATTGKSQCDIVVPLHLLFSPTGFHPRVFPVRVLDDWTLMHLGWAMR
ncbi:hypothetical protein Taro_052261 [Colocasia esculenta]|uniref:Uncharacterized protein n=1 Tax=Colocasia esculenta TaxID=4460 RepID=A0A843XJC0_COLES|nr:hypothetical protein [Colocasia esculenta]